MAFKADTSFLRFVTMGAAGARRTMALLRERGFEPIELERYATSNKIWATKIKRLRLPDLLCVRTGLRVEVKAKSTLVVKMSDAPANPQRVWHAGLRDQDVVAFLTVRDIEGVPVAAKNANFFRVADLKATEAHSRLGPPKSASEGAERDREWPTYVPTADGEVAGVVAEGPDGPPTALRLLVERADGTPRAQPYPLRGKHAYVRAGDRFVGGQDIIAGVMPAMADLSVPAGNRYDPLADLEAVGVVDRYAAVKALPHRVAAGAEARRVVERLEARMREDDDARVRLEAAASAAALGSTAGERELQAVVDDPQASELRMEAVFVLTELHGSVATEFAAAHLRSVAGTGTAPSELRQAAIWGLGFVGHRQFDALLPFLDDPDENVALHAIAAFGPATPPKLVRELVARLDEAAPRLAAAASEALRVIASDVVIEELAAAVASPTQRDWALATLGRLEPSRVRAAVRDPAVLRALAPLMRVFSEENWLATGDRAASLAYLVGQRY